MSSSHCRASILLVFALLLSSFVVAQRPHGEFDSFTDRFYTGGSFGLNIGSRVTQIDLQPLGGFWILPQWNVGMSGWYSYRNERFNLEHGTSKPRKNHIWGVTGFTQILPIPDFYDVFNINIHGGVVLHGEYECLYIDKKLVNMNDATGKEWVNLYFVGGGWRQRVGDRSAVNLLVLWNLSDNSYSPYLDNPILRFSITF